MTQTLIAGGVFLFTYALIITERVHRTVSALLGAVAILLAGVLSQEQAMRAVDWNVIFLLAGMMIIANLLSETGIFQWFAVKAVLLGRGEPFRILIILSLFTAISSAFLDNVTIVILVAPVTLFIASSLNISPIPFLIAEVLASNIGGAATLIGDPPNLLISSAAGIDFLTFSANMAPISILILLVFLALSRVLFRADLAAAGSRTLRLDALQTDTLITDRTLLAKSTVIIALVMLGFMVHGFLHLEPATIALTGATLLLLWTRRDPHPVMQNIEWTTLFFFVGLFITVEAVVEVGLIERAAQGLLRLTGGDLNLTATLLLWMSAIASGVVDNIPYTATMIPIVASLGESMPLEPLWWSLALGACLGGNATLVGASANVVVADIAARSGRPIRFREFLPYGVVTTVVSMIMATAYVWLRYL